MTDKRITQLSLIFTAVTGLAVLIWWITTDPTRQFVPHVPGMDNRQASVFSAQEVTIGQFFTEFEKRTAPEIPGSWPRFRGAGFDNISPENIALSRDWTQPPEILWSVDLGEGHAAPAVDKGRVYVLDYLEEEKADALRCFSLETGRELWRRWYPVKVKRNHGMSRTIPAVADTFVVTIGPRCHVMCVQAETGRLFWGLDLVKDFNAGVPFWYTGQCPLIDDGAVILAPGGRALMTAVDCATGRILWETPNPDGWTMSHSSVMPVVLDGQKMYVYCMTEGVIGVAADSARQGELLWKTTAWSHSVIAPSPLAIGGNRLLLTAGYGAGSMILEITENGGNYTAEVIQSCTPDSGFASEQQTPLLINKHLFGVLPKDAGPLRNQFVCADPSDLTRIIWSSGPVNRFGLGPYLLAGELFFLLNDDGHLFLLEYSEKAFKLLTDAKILDGHDAWGPMALVSGRLLLRDSKRMVCIDVRKKG